MNKSSKGITLIALVITIVVLLILAGVSIAMLTGENGILTKAQTASDETKQKGAHEKVKLAVAESYDKGGHFNYNDFKKNVTKIEGFEKIEGQNVIVDGVTIKVDPTTGKTQLLKTGETGDLPSNENTKPYFPGSDFTQVAGTTIDNGLTIKDRDGNGYVWVEVPKTIYTTATSNTDYENIEKDMQSYATDYRVADNLDQLSTCGLTTDEYNNLKQTMLKSVYDNGGFWIGQYEAGTDTARNKKEDPLTTPQLKEGLYPYNCVTCIQAQQLSSEMNSGNYTSSLMFGIQWDLTLKFIESKGDKTKEQLKTNSDEWGNYHMAEFTVAKGKYLDETTSTYIEVNGSYKKASDSRILLTTGITDRNSALHIYDLAGNLLEWTLELHKPLSGSVPRGGYYGYSYPASMRYSVPGNTGGASDGFRPVIF